MTGTGTLISDATCSPGDVALSGDFVAAGPPGTLEIRESQPIPTGTENAWRVGIISTVATNSLSGNVVCFNNP